MIMRWDSALNGKIFQWQGRPVMLLCYTVQSVSLKGFTELLSACTHHRLLLSDPCTRCFNRLSTPSKAGRVTCLTELRTAVAFLSSEHKLCSWLSSFAACAHSCRRAWWLADLLSLHESHVGPLESPSHDGTPLYGAELYYCDISQTANSCSR